MKMKPDNAGVRFPPPFIYVAAVVGGYLLNRLWRLPVGGAMIWQIVEWLSFGLCLALTFGSIGLFWGRRTSIIPNRPSNALVVAGPYHFTRNPMYVGLALLTVALGILLNTWWPVILLVPALMIVQGLVIRPEEAYLRRRFGAEYEAYSHRVRRWI